MSNPILWSLFNICSQLEPFFYYLLLPPTIYRLQYVKKCLFATVGRILKILSILHVVFILYSSSRLCAAVQQVAGLPADWRKTVLKGHSTPLKVSLSKKLKLQLYSDCNSNISRNKKNVFQQAKTLLNIRTPSCIKWCDSSSIHSFFVNFS